MALSKVTTMAFLATLLIVLNVLSLVSASVHGFLYKGLSSLPISGLLGNSPTKRYSKLSNEKKILNKKLTTAERRLALSQKTPPKQAISKVRTITKRIVNRSVRNTVRNVGLTPAESIPFVGTGLVIFATAYDVKDSCDTMKDMNEIMSTMGLNEFDGEADKVCGHEFKFREKYAAMNNNVGGFINHLKEESVRKFDHLKDTVDGTSSIAIEKMKKNADRMYDTLGRTLYYMINE